MSPVITKVYGERDTGCCVDNCRGIYMVDRIVEIANQHGANIRHDCSTAHPCWTPVSDNGSEFAGCEFSSEYWAEATAYMNEHYGAEGYYWGSADHSGDWGFWAIYDEDAPTPEREKIAYALSERTGKDIDPLDVRIEGGWLFYRDIDNPLEIECYRLPLPICAEPWTDIPLKDSPFESNNADAVSKAIEKLDHDYPE